MARKIGEYDFKMPRKDVVLAAPHICKTFSVGVFKWVRTTGLAGMRPAKALVRISGPTTPAGYAQVHGKAKEVMLALEAGTYTGPKLVRVGA